MRDEYATLLIAAIALAVLPFALDVAGLPLRSAIDVVVFAIACMGLNVLVGVVRGVTIYFNPSWGEASMYLLMALVLLVRPRGLFGERIQKFE